MTILDTLTLRMDADTAPLRRELGSIEKTLFAFEENLSFGFPEIEKSLDEMAGRWRAVSNSVKDVTEATTESQERLATAIRDVEGALTTAFSDSIVEGEKLSDVLKQLEKDLAKIALRRFVAEPLVDAAGNVFGSLAKSILGFADGGRPPMGRVSLVGEEGPELFVPDAAGTIVPNHALGGSVTVVQNISIAPDVSAVARAEIGRALPMIRNYAAQGITDARLRGALPA